MPVDVCLVRGEGGCLGVVLVVCNLASRGSFTMAWHFAYQQFVLGRPILPALYVEAVSFRAARWAAREELPVGPPALAPLMAGLGFWGYR